MKTQAKKYILLLAFFYIFLATIYPFIEDIIEGYHDSIHIAQEGFIALLCIVSIYIIWQEIANNYYNVNSLKQSLKKETQDKKIYSQQVGILKVGLLKVLNDQFKQWSLSKSEQEVALLLIKGLSFEQISQIRGTKEKTIRQQASAIYLKSNLDGRSHLAAYFLEDLL